VNQAAKELEDEVQSVDNLAKTTDEAVSNRSVSISQIEELAKKADEEEAKT